MKSKFLPAVLLLSGLALVGAGCGDKADQTTTPTANTNANTNAAVAPVNDATTTNEAMPANDAAPTNAAEPTDTAADEAAVDRAIGTQTYNNFGYGFSIAYPADFTQNLEEIQTSLGKPSLHVRFVTEDWVMDEQNIQTSGTSLGLIMTEDSSIPENLIKADYAYIFTANPDGSITLGEPTVNQRDSDMTLFYAVGLGPDNTRYQIIINTDNRFTGDQIFKDVIASVNLAQ